MATLKSNPVKSDDSHSHTEWAWTQSLLQKKGSPKPHLHPGDVHNKTPNTMNTKQTSSLMTLTLTHRVGLDTVIAPTDRQSEATPISK